MQLSSVPTEYRGFNIEIKDIINPKNPNHTVRRILASDGKKYLAAIFDIGSDDDGNWKVFRDALDVQIRRMVYAIKS